VPLPDPHGSQAVLIGTSRYESADLPDLPAVENNLLDLAALLTDPALCGLPCVSLADPPDPRAVYRVLRQSAAEALDLLLVYIACHGRTGPRNELYLTVAGTDPGELPVSALAYDLVREVVRDSPAANRVVILDCCFSGRAIPDMAGDAETVLGQVGVEGSYVLTATPANAVALAPEGSRHTAFTGELLDLIRNGVPAGPELLTFATLYRQLAHRTRTRGLPTPCQRGTGTVDRLALTRNPAFTAMPDPASAVPAEPAPAELVPTSVLPAESEPDPKPVADRSLLTRRALIGAAGVAVVTAAGGTASYLLRTDAPATKTNRFERTLRGHDGPVSGVAFHPSGTLVATASYDGTAKLWNLTTGAHVLTVEDKFGPIQTVVFSPDGTCFATPGHVWATQNGQQPTLIRPASVSTAYSVAFSPDGKNMATGYADSTIAVQSVADGRIVATIRNAHPSGVTSLTFSRDSRLLVTGGTPVKFWNISTGRTVMNLAEGGGPVAYAPGGNSIATQGSDESSIRLWDTASGRNTAIFNGYHGLIRALSYHPDGKTLASGGEDHAVRRWQVPTGDCAPLTGHTATVLAVVYHPSGSLLASAGEDGTARIWNAR
jgi:hypothetical protein